MPRRLIGLCSLLFALLLLAGSALAQQPAATPQATPSAVVREILNDGHPAAAPGQVLELVRYTIPPQMTLPVHIHPGMQVAFVESGTLTYTVVEGEATVTQGGVPGTLGAGEEVDLNPGDTVTEPAGMVHFGANRTDAPIVLLVASLFAADEPPSAIVEASPMATPAAGS